MHGRVLPLPNPPGAEDGFGLIEVIVSALLIAIVAVGVYSGLDSASATSGINKSRALATEVAQQDQERMRAYRASDLSNLRTTRTQAVAGVSYTVTSRADWITDSSGTSSCKSGTAKANYLKISSTVTWPGKPTGLQPVNVSSLVAPPNGSFAANQGSLAIEVTDRNGAGVAALPVSIAGPESHTDSTNEIGCVLWGFLPAGSYTASFSRPGWVDHDGNGSIAGPVSVTGEATNTSSFAYDQAGQIAFTFDTQPYGRAPLVSKAASVMVGNSGLGAGFRRFDTSDGQPGPSITATSLFPFTNPYAVWAGNCLGQAPAAPAFQNVGPGSSSPVTVRMPALNLTVTKLGTPLNGANVRAYVRTAGCAGAYSTTSDPSGHPVDPGLPFGTYDVCVDDGTLSKTLTGVVDTDPAGTTPQSVDLGTGASAGRCPAS